MEVLSSSKLFVLPLLLTELYMPTTVKILLNLTANFPIAPHALSPVESVVFPPWLLSDRYPMKSRRLILCALICELSICNVVSPASYPSIIICLVRSNICTNNNRSLNVCDRISVTFIMHLIGDIHYFKSPLVIWLIQ